MGFTTFKGTRRIESTKNNSITLFLISFIYPISSGYHVRMDLLIRWANLRFSTVNLIIKSNNWTKENIDNHLAYCNNLFIIPTKKPSNQILKLFYVLITGRYPQFDSFLFLEKSLSMNFNKVFSENKTQYFLNTRNNFGGLIKYIPKGTISLFDTQDIFTDMHIKYGMFRRKKWLQKYLLGYKENGYFVKSEVTNLSKYDTIIAISDSDYKKYYSNLLLRNKLVKIESIGIEPKENAVATIQNKEFDCLIVASDFKGSQEGIQWFFSQVAPFLTKRISLCVVGTICDFIIDQNYKNEHVDLILQGYISDVSQYYNKSKIVILVMQEATGTSVKGLEALAYGASIVTTPSGVRFGGLENNTHCIIEERPKPFAESIEFLIQNPKKRIELGQKALEFAKEKQSIESAFKLLDSCIIREDYII